MIILNNVTNVIMCYLIFTDSRYIIVERDN